MVPGYIISSIATSKLDINSSIATTKLEYNAKIFCIIMTTANNLELKARVIYDSWASKCDNHVFVSFIPHHTPSFERVELKYKNIFNVLKPEGLMIDQYDKLTDKVYKSFKDVYINHRNYDWYLKADDDTFIFNDNLRLFLADKNQNDPVTFGYHLKGYGGFLSGGAGYVLSKESLQRLGSKLITNQKYCPNTGIEDVDVAQCLRSLGVFPSNSTDILGRERFHSSA